MPCVPRCRQLALSRESHSGIYFAVDGSLRIGTIFTARCVECGKDHEVAEARDDEAADWDNSNEDGVLKRP